MIGGDHRPVIHSDQPFKSEADIYSLATAPVAPPTQAHVWRFSSSRRDCLSSQSCCGMCTVASSSSRKPRARHGNVELKPPSTTNSIRSVAKNVVVEAHADALTAQQQTHFGVRRRHIRCHDATYDVTMLISLMFSSFVMDALIDWRPCVREVCKGMLRHHEADWPYCEYNEGGDERGIDDQGVACTRSY